LGALFVRRGATVRHGPAIRIVPLADDTELRRATTALLDAPVDVVVATTGIGLRGWIEAAESWGLGRALLETLAATTVLTRGPKVTGAVRAAGLCESYAPDSARTADLLRHLLDRGVAGVRIAVQLHGRPQRDFVDTLRRSGAEVLEIPVYRGVGPADPGPLDRLLDGVLDGTVDALTFTSAPAAAGTLERAHRTGRHAALVEELTRRVVVGCVGPIAAAPLEEAGVPTVRPDSARIGALAHTVAGVLRDR
ncbi:uroporphyrinogen-III synthase, partial [Saccharomonospora iraqiensis]|uniref:uroporphyrinogen-III synthase n=1 Tax=Saccharomonospora iraqiensis TaxID=52698 RepID=UPI000A0345DD